MKRVLKSIILSSFIFFEEYHLYIIFLIYSCRICVTVKNCARGICGFNNHLENHSIFLCFICIICSIKKQNLTSETSDVEETRNDVLMWRRVRRDGARCGAPEKFYTWIIIFLHCRERESCDYLFIDTETFVYIKSKKRQREISI